VAHLHHDNGSEFYKHFIRITNQRVQYVMDEYNSLRMKGCNMSDHTLQAGIALVWAAVIIGVSFLTEAEGSRALDWELLWVLLGGFITQHVLVRSYISKQRKAQS
jgi:di/tricarboxylate transporter